MNVRLGLATLALCALAVPASYAQDITGAWSFKSEVKRKGSTLTGSMTISRPDENGLRTCSFVSSETLVSEPDLNIQMDQSCRVTPQGNNFIIRSKVIGTLTENYSIGNYLADHFVVKPTSSKEMKGIWQDARYSAPVIFWRDDNLPVS